MGARINFVFKQSENDSPVVLYSHWGETMWKTDLAYSLDKARPRWTDATYGTRIVISQLIASDWDSETGYGIYSIDSVNTDLGDTKVIVDFTNFTVTDEDGESHSFDSFITYIQEAVQFETV